MAVHDHEYDQVRELVSTIMEQPAEDVTVIKFALIAEVEMRGVTSFFAVNGHRKDGENLRMSDWDELGMVNFWREKIKQAIHSEIGGYAVTGEQHRQNPGAVNEAIERAKAIDDWARELLKGQDDDEQ